MKAMPWLDRLTKAKAKKLLGPAQVAIFVMAGGGMIGRMYAEQPADAYVDQRAGRLPYKQRDLMLAQYCLVRIAETAGLDTHNLPAMPDFSNLGVF